MHLRSILVIAVVATVPALVRGAGQPQSLQPLTITQLEGAPRQVAVPGSQTAPQPTPLPGAVLGVPQQPTEPLLPASVIVLDQQQTHPVLDGPRISLTFDDARPVVEIFRLLFAGTNVSFIPSPGVDQTFVGELNNVTVREALDLITEATGLDYTVQGNIVRLSVRELETRLYSVDRVITQRGGSRSMSASTGAGVGGGATSAGATAGGAGAGGTATAGSGGSGGSSSSVGGNDAPDPFGELEEGVMALLSADGVMNLNETAAVLQVTDVPSRLARVEQYLETVMTRMMRQVQIEARVIEVELRDEFSAGINWSALLSSLSSVVRISQTTTNNTGGGFTLGLQIGDFAALLSAFETQGRVNVMASPRVTAMNNEPAVMRIGRQNVFFTTVTQTSESGQILQTAATPQNITEGVVISVTAQISSDNIINMSINPSITEFAGVATSRFGDTAPILNVRETDTIVRVREGETIVIAGLMAERVTNDTSRVPVLGSLPVVGGAFRSTTRNHVKTDLVILLTPRVMTPAEVPGVTARELRRLDTANKAGERGR